MINNVNTQISILRNYDTPNTSRFDRRVFNSRDSIRLYWEDLRQALHELERAYDQIKSTDGIDNINMDLRDVFEVIYSPRGVEEDRIDGAIDLLQRMIIEHLTDTNYAVESELIGQLSNSIIFLGEFARHRNLAVDIEIFETTNLNRAFIIETETDVAQETVDGEAESDGIAIISVCVNEWNERRRVDIAIFTRLLRSLPDIELLIQTLEDDAVELSKHTDYVDKAMMRAYELSRRNLEGISHVERSWNFLSSDFRFMAVYCLLIAIFKDVSSFLIGIFIYYTEKRKNKKGVADLLDESLDDAV